MQSQKYHADQNAQRINQQQVQTSHELHHYPRNTPKRHRAKNMKKQHQAAHRKVLNPPRIEATSPAVLWSAALRPLPLGGMSLTDGLVSVVSV